MFIASAGGGGKAFETCVSTAGPPDPLVIDGLVVGAGSGFACMEVAGSPGTVGVGLVFDGDDCGASGDVVGEADCPIAVPVRPQTADSATAEQNSDLDNVDLVMIVSFTVNGLPFSIQAPNHIANGQAETGSAPSADF